MMMGKISITKNELSDLYIDRKLSAVDIGKRLNCSERTIRKHLKKNNIPIRSAAEASRLKIGKIGEGLLLTENKLRHLYLDKQLSGLDIANKFNINQATVYNHINKMGISRGLSESSCLAKQDPSKNPYYKGGRIKNTYGYIEVYEPEHHRANKSGRVLEHIKVWEEIHQRCLPKGWVIHHLNGVKDDNRPNNLVAMKKGEHGNLAAPFKKRIRELESENRLLKRALEDSQMIFYCEN